MKTDKRKAGLTMAAKMTKDEMHRLVVSGLLRETFTSVDFSFRIDVSKIREIIIANPERWPKSLVPIDEAVVDFLHRVREIDEDRVQSLSLIALREPIFVSTFEDGKVGVCPIDGHHRMIRLSRINQLPTAAVAYVIPWQELPRSEDKIEILWGNKQVDHITKDWKLK